MAALLQNTCKTDDRMLISTIYKLRKEQNSPNILNGQTLLEDETLQMKFKWATVE